MSLTNFWLTIKSVVVFAGILGLPMFRERVEPDPTVPWSRHRKVTEIVTFAAQQTRKVCCRLEVCEHPRKAGQAKHSISFRHSQNAFSYLKFLLQLTKIISREILYHREVAQFFYKISQFYYRHISILRGTATFRSTAIFLSIRIFELLRIFRVTYPRLPELLPIYWIAQLLVWPSTRRCPIKRVSLC